MSKKYQLKVETVETVSLEPEKVADLEHSVEQGDTWAKLGAKYKPAGVTGFDHAKHLQQLNGGAQLRPGSVVKL